MEVMRRDLRRLVLSDEHGGAALELDDGHVITANRAARALLPEAAPNAPTSALASGVAHERLQLALRAGGPVVWERDPALRFVVMPAPDGGHLLLALACPAPDAVTTEQFLALNSQLTTLLGENARLLADTRRQAAAREHVLGVVSHHLRSPLALIRTAATTIVRHARGTGRQEEGLTRAAEAIQRAARRMSALAQELIDAEQVDIGQLGLRLVRQPLLPIVEEAVEAFRPVAAEQGLKLRVEDGRPDLLAPCDRERILQVLANLLDNACRFTPTGGRVAVAARRTGARLVVEVTDSGPGIAAEDLPRVFDRGWTKGAEDGLGLGLFISRAIVEAHGGVLSVESQPAGGCRFWFSLPAPGSRRDSGCPAR